MSQLFSKENIVFSNNYVYNSITDNDTIIPLCYVSCHIYVVELVFGKILEHV